MAFTGVRTPLGRQFVPPGFLQARQGPSVWNHYEGICAVASCCTLDTDNHVMCGSEEHHSKRLPLYCSVQAAEAPAEEGGLGSRYSFRQRFYSTLPPTLDNELRVRGQRGLTGEAGICAAAWFMCRGVWILQPWSHCMLQ